MTSLQQTAMGGGSATAKTANYTLVSADAGTTVAMNAAGSTTITVNTSLFAAGDTVYIQNIGAGISTITPGTATVNSSASLALAQYEGGQLYFTSASASIFIKGAGASAGLASDSATVATSQGTTSQTFTDLATAGPAVTITTGTKALVIVTSEMISGGMVGCVAGYAVSGATTIAATDTTSAEIVETANATGVTSRASAASRLTTLTAGSNTFTMKYHSTVVARSADFKNREIIVIDLGS
jgi:hypothetical protein